MISSGRRNPKTRRFWRAVRSWTARRSSSHALTITAARQNFRLTTFSHRFASTSPLFGARTWTELPPRTRAQRPSILRSKWVSCKLRKRRNLRARTCTESSNPVRSATQSGLQKSSATPYSEIRERCPFLRYSLDNLDWRERTARHQIRSVSWLFSGRHIRSPVSSRALGECNAITRLGKPGIRP